MLRTPSAIEGEGGAITEAQSRERGRMLQVRDPMAQLAAENGLKVSDGIASSLLPTPAVGHIRNHDEPIEDYLARRQKMEDGEYRGMPGVSLGVAVRMEMLPMPNTMEHREIKTPEQIAELKAKSPSGYRNLRESVVNELLPTPQAMEGAKGNNLSVADRAATGQVMLSNYAVEITTSGPAIFNSGEVTLLKTPQVDDSKNTGHNQDRRPTLASEVWEAERITSWGKFEPAIRRWEQVLGRPAPSPTLPDGKDGNHRLSAFFTEWMMGLELGHVTNSELGLSRVEMLKLCGNGVVPQQAELALRMLLEGTMPFTNTQAERGGGMSMFPTPTVSDIYTGDLKSSQQKEGSMHSVTLPQAVKLIETKETK